MGREDHPAFRYSERGQHRNFSVHMTAEVYDYVIDWARSHDVNRNRAVNQIIAEHAEAARKRAARRLRAAR